MDENIKYESPSIKVIGTVEDLTQGNLDGDSLDADFPEGTPKRDLRFS